MSTAVQKEMKILSAQEVRQQLFLIRQSYVEQDFQKIKEQVAAGLSSAIESLHTHLLPVCLPDFYRDQPKLAKALLSKLVIFFLERQFAIVNLLERDMGLSIQWRATEDLLIEIFEKKDEQSLSEIKFSPFSADAVTAKTVRERQYLYHRQPVLQELAKLKEQVLQKISEAQISFQEDCVISFEDCPPEYTKLLFLFMTQEFQAQRYLLTALDEQHLKISWASTDSDEEEAETKEQKVIPLDSPKALLHVPPPSPIAPAESLPTPNSLEVDFSDWSNEKILAQLLVAGGNHALQLSKGDSKSSPESQEAHEEAKIQLVMYHTEALKRMKQYKRDEDTIHEAIPTGSVQEEDHRHVRVRQ